MSSALLPVGLSGWLRDRSRMYPTDPVGYMREFLHVNPSERQQDICRALCQPPFMVQVASCNNVGKSFLAACLASWWYDSFTPSMTLITAPKYDSVRDIIFRELRNVRPIKGGFLPKATRLQDSHDHFIDGFTCNSEESFKGKHAARMLFILDEAVGLDSWVFNAVKTMFKGDGSHALLILYNPTDTSSEVFRRETSGECPTIRLNALEHENIAAGVAGLPAPYPPAVDYHTTIQRIKSECEPIDSPDPNIDFEFGGVWYRPTTPEFEVQVLGRWPRQAVNTVWDERSWQRCLNRVDPRHDWPIQIGCDVARYGDDETAIHVRIGMCSLRHETHKGKPTNWTADRLKVVAHEVAADRDPKSIPIAIDVGGMGAGVVDNAGGYNFVAVNAGSQAGEPSRYPNIRSELWFNTVELAKEGLIDLTRLPESIRHQLRLELLAPTYSLDTIGRRVVESKDKTKSRLRRSPDNADAFNLAYLMV